MWLCHVDKRIFNNYKQWSFYTQMTVDQKFVDPKNMVDPKSFYKSKHDHFLANAVNPKS